MMTHHSTQEQPLKILIVDDDRLLVSGTICLVRDRFPDAQIFSAFSAQDALAQVTEHLLNLVIADLSIPETAGTAAHIEKGLGLLKRLMQDYPDLNLMVQTCIDLHRPLHNLFHEVYVFTLKRNLPYFKTIQVKVRNFAPLEQPTLTLELKRDLCLWLEEALCNLGKHAQVTTRIVVTGQHHEGHYVLKVQDNGSGLKPEQGYQGTKLSTLLAQRLGGTFRRESLPKGGVICELSWSVG